MRTRKIKRLAVVLTSGLVLGTACLPQNYWADLLGNITTEIVTSAIEATVGSALDTILPGTTQ